MMDSLLSLKEDHETNIPCMYQRIEGACLPACLRACLSFTSYLLPTMSKASD